MRQPNPALNDSATENLYWAKVSAQIINPTSERLYYADWTASGRLYQPIESRLSQQIGGYMANTHTEDSLTGRTMTHWLHQAEARIKKHVNAAATDVLISTGSGMTGALGKLIRMMGWWAHEDHKAIVKSTLVDQPLVYITHREHHSNHTMWLESLAEVRMIPALAGDEIDLDWLAEDLLSVPAGRTKLASVTAASNVTGVRTPYRRIARLMHENNGLCFIDFAASAPYDAIDMHPNDSEYLDAIFFSPHKFLGGPGSQGVLIFSSQLYHNQVPEQPGGGTVVWTNPWGEHRFVADIEQRENGGTPGILQTLKAALAINLKEELGVERIHRRENILNAHFFKRLETIGGVKILAPQHRQRLSIFSIVFLNVHYKVAVRMLSDYFSVQARGGCACAGTYGHVLLGIDRCASRSITDLLDQDNEADKPGWVRISLHPSMTLEELDYIADAVEAVANLDVDKPVVSAGSDIQVPDIWRSFI